MITIYIKWCIFDYNRIIQADFDFGLNEINELLKQFSCFFHCQGSRHESDTRSAYNDFKFLAKEMFKARGSVGLSDLVRICFRHEKFQLSFASFRYALPSKPLVPTVKEASTSWTESKQRIGAGWSHIIWTNSWWSQVHHYSIGNSWWWKWWWISYLRRFSNKYR